MSFVNEYISEEDFKKYGIEEINRQHYKANVGNDWTVDHERGIYLRWLVSGREECAGENDFHLYWKGSLIWLKLKVLDFAGVRGGAGQIKWGLIDINLPESLNSARAEIIRDLKDALAVYGEFGMYSTVHDCVTTFEF